MKQFLTTVLLLFLLSANALQIRTYQPGRHDRFSSGYPGSPVPNISPSFIAKDYDLSGIGWRTNNADVSHALITPRHFVGAVHNQPNIGQKLRFFNQNGTLKTYTIGDIFIMQEGAYPTDLFVGELTTPILDTDSIHHYPVGNLPAETDYLGDSILTYGKTARIGAGTVDGFGNLIIPLSATDTSVTRAFVFDYDKAGGDADDAHGEAGDSGSPTFIMQAGKLVLIGMHSSLFDDEDNNRFRTIDAFLPHYIDQINDSIAPSGYQINMPLPVAFLDFSATAKNDGSVLLHWATASEQDNAGFVVERVQKAVSGTVDWKALGFVPGQGTSTTPQHYQFVDASPLAGQNFYRLQQKDRDGTSTTSAVVQVELRLAPKRLTVFPNPVRDQLSVQGVRQNQTLRIVDRKGRLWLATTKPEQISVSFLPKGSYWLTDGQEVVSFVKL